MFNNLIESSSHAREFKRRGSFFLLTTAAYAMLFIAGGVASIYAYDAQLDDQTSEEVTMLAPVDLPARTREPDRQPASESKQKNQESFDRRRDPMASTSHPELTPRTVSTKPNENLPVRDHFPTVKSGYDSNATVPNGPFGPAPNIGAFNDRGSNLIVDNIGTAPPAPTPRPVPKIVQKRVINSEAIELPKPPYPPIALQTRVQGTVAVQVLIDETGKVISARAVSGHPLLVPEARKAAYRARFSPTMIGDQPVKVSGVITYNFVLQ